MSLANSLGDAARATVVDRAAVIGDDVDLYGPREILEFENPTLGARAIFVLHNVSRGPAIGGCRFAPDVTAREVYELARAMTWKNAAALIPHGGAKSAIVASPSEFPFGSDRRRQLIEWVADCLAPYPDYIPGPDMSTDERDMDVIFAKTGRSIGRTNGVELDKLGLTALGALHALRVLVDGGYVPKLERLSGATLAIEGFGNVGAAFARFAAEDGARVVAVSDFVDPARDYGGVVYHPRGLDLDALLRLRESGRSVVDLEQTGAQIFRGRAELKSVFAFPVDVLVPAARTNSIDIRTATTLQAKVVLQAANAPLTLDAERHLHERGVVCGVDYIVNCGGVIGGAEEWAELTRPLGALRIPHCVARIIEAVGTNIPVIHELARARDVTPREAAAEIVRPRIGA